MCDSDRSVTPADFPQRIFGEPVTLLISGMRYTLAVRVNHCGNQEPWRVSMEPGISERQELTEVGTQVGSEVGYLQTL
jgi:hypothetical protein